jgi:nucleoside-diphosphate-sugar epimerase
MNIFILGINGFIGCSLLEHIIQKQPQWNVRGIDIHSHKIKTHLHYDKLTFHQGDVFKEKQWIKEAIEWSDVVLPLVAIANPALYVKEPLRVFELDFESNLEIIRLCVDFKKRIIFPSTSEVYGMCPDDEFDEETSNLVTGPIQKERWIYSCSKQMLDRLIYAYGNHHGLDYTLFRPFNWLGAHLDDMLKGGRVLSQFMSDIIYKQTIHLMDGGSQRRSFTDIDDAMNAMLSIIENKNGCANRGVFNIGNPNNDMSIHEFSQLLLEILKEYPILKEKAEATKVVNIESTTHFGAGYQDVQRRLPSIERAHTKLGWTPTVTTKESIHKIIQFHLETLQHECQ